jgi:UDPglucose 6-dehydrogenase
MTSERAKPTMQRKRVAVIGSGYVGTVVAGCLAHIGHDVIGVEVDPSKLAALASGRAPFYEEGLDDLLAEGVTSGRLRFRGDIAGAMAASDVVFIAVGTPTGPTGAPDMTAMRAVAAEMAPHVRHHILVNKSTVPVGSGRWLASMIEEAAPVGARSRHPVRVVSNPEFLREGSAVSDYLYPDRIVVGGEDAEAVTELVEIYRPIIEGVSGARVEPVPVVRTDLVTAEMLKYASNAFLATKISFANELARICEFVGADITEVTAGMGLDSRIGGMFLAAGLGWGGSCFGKDTAALIATARDYNFTARILESTVGVNDGQRQMVVQLLLQHLRTLRGARIALFGLAFKAGTDDLRDSPAVDVARRLAEHGCFVAAYDPMVDSVPGAPDIRIAPDPYTAARNADAIVIATDWPMFAQLDLQRLHAEAPGALVLDGRNLLDPLAVEAVGFRYQGIGRRSTPQAGTGYQARPAAGDQWPDMAESAA